MYIPEKFKEQRVDVLHSLMRRHPLAILVATGEQGLIANHIPMEVLDTPPFGVLRGHIARANPLWKQYRDGSEALAIFQGPQTYISPSFYPTKQKTGEVVPTWNYAVAHARGPIRFTHDADWLRELVGRLTQHHEAARSAPWGVGDAPEAYIKNLLGLIVGFEITISELVGKWKLSQNQVLENREGVLQGLRANDDPDSHEMIEMLGS
jgi:transcriptional regulator